MNSARRPGDRPGRRRVGISTFAVVGLLFLLGGIGYALSWMARQSGRSSTWFYQSQTAHNLADAGLKECARVLADAGVPAPGATDPVSLVYRALRGGSVPATTLPLLAHTDAALPPEVARQLAALATFSPELTVELRVLDNAPLRAAPTLGIPPDDQERQGRIQIVSRAAITHASGLKVERTLTLERRFRVVNVLPPLVGRFALFIHENDGVDPNFLRLRADPTGGREVAAGPGRPLVVIPGPPQEFVAPGSAVLEHRPFASPVAGTEFLDRQGWIYLGPGASGEPWRLRVAHGFGDLGESHLVSAYRAPSLYKGDPGEHAVFRARVMRELSRPPGICDVDFSTPRDGFYLAHHGFAENYEILTLDPSQHRGVQDAAGDRTRVDFGGGEAGGLRLFGTPHEVSPTLVFGPVYREYFRRAGLRLTLGASMLPGDCPRPGSMLFNIYRRDDHVPVLQTAFDQVFESDMPAHATGRVEEPYAAALNLVLDDRVNGFFGASGVLFGAPDLTATPPPYSSAAVPEMAAIPQIAGLPAPALDRLWRGDLDLPGFFRGSLGDGLPAVTRVLREKLTYLVDPAAVSGRLLVGGRLRVPGVAMVDVGGGDLSLGPVTEVDQGGILISSRGLTITGDIRRGPADEPLTLVALDGDLVIAAGVTRVEAHLIAVRGRVRFPGNHFTLAGGLAARYLDLSTSATGSRNRLEFSDRHDPTNPGVADPYYRIFYGADAQLVAGGRG